MGYIEEGQREKFSPALFGGEEIDTRKKTASVGQRRDGALLSAVPHRLNGTDLSWEEFWDNLCLRYGLIPQDIPATCYGCSSKFLIEHALSCPKGGLFLAWHDAAAKEWGAHGARALVPSAITYKPKINSRKVEGERTGEGARQDRG